jgi:hypothetical protein
MILRGKVFVLLRIFGVFLGVFGGGVAILLLLNHLSSFLNIFLFFYFLVPCAFLPFKST